MREEYDLLPCPFCGGVPRWGSTEDGEEFIECSDCKCTTPLGVPIMDSPRDHLTYIWNRRTDAASKLIARMSAAISAVENLGPK